MVQDNIKDRELIGRLMEHTGWSASKIASEAGLAASTLTRIAKGQSAWSLKPATIEALKRRYAPFFEREAEAQQSGYAEIEILPSYAGMGGGGSGEGERMTALIPMRLVREKLHAQPNDLIMIECRGDSMQPEFLHGDQILVDRRDTDPVQPGAFALWDGDGYVVKLVERIPQRRGWFRIFSRNDVYTPYEVEASEVRIMGRPVWVGREL